MSKSYTLTTRTSWSQTRDDIRDTFRKWGVYEYDIDGGISPSRAENRNQTLDERSVAIRYKTAGGQEIVLTMSRQDRAVDNLRVLYLALEAMRLNEARGIDDVIREAYLQLNAAPRVDPYELLGVRPDADLEIIEAAYRAAMKRYHPDTHAEEEREANTARTAALNDAMDRIKTERNGTA